MNKLVVSFFIIVLGFSGCKTLRPVLSTEKKDSIVTNTVIKIDTVWHDSGFDSLTFAYLIQCGADNIAKDYVIDSLSKKLDARVEIKNGVLTVKVKNRPDKYYSLYVYNLTRAEIYRSLIKSEVRTVTVKNPVNSKLLLAVVILSAVLIFIIYRKYACVSK